MQLLAELPLHLALFACGALGWAITKWVTYRFCVPRRAPAGKALFPEPEDDEVVQVEADVMSEGPMEDSQQAIAAGPSPLRRRRRQRRTGAAVAELPSAAAPALSGPEAARCEVAQEEEALEQESFEAQVPAEEAAQEDAAADAGDAEAEAAPAPTTQADAATEAKAQEASAEEAVPAVSERVARLLAKKAERKARKAQEKLELERHDSQASQSTLSPSDSAVALLSETASSGGSALGEPTPLAYSTSSGEDLEASDSIIVAEQEDTSGKSEEAAASGEDRAADEEGDDEGVWEEDEEEEQEEEDCRAEQDCSQQAAARLEWAEAAEEEDGEEWRCHPAAAVLEDAGPWADEWEAEAGACPDGWMLPLEEMHRGPSAAAPSELAVPSPQFFTPILSCDGQRLYTDGDVVYMMACVESPEGQSQEAGQMLRPVVDPADPLHGVMELLSVAAAAPNTWGPAQSLPNMSMPAAPRRHDGDRRPWQEKRGRPAASAEEEDAAWGVCWDLFCKPW